MSVVPIRIGASRTVSSAMSANKQFPSERGSLFSIDAASDRLKGSAQIEQLREGLREIAKGNSEGAARIESLLRLGAEWLEVESGYLTDIDPAAGTHTIIEPSASRAETAHGGTTDLSNTYCRTVLAEGKALAIANAPAQGWAGDPAYENSGWSTYFGAKVVVDGDLFGTVCFVDQDPRNEPFNDADAAVLAHTVQAVEQELARSRQETRIQSIPAQLEALFTGSPDMLYLHDGQGTLLLPNPRLCEKTGYERRALTRMKVWELDCEMEAEDARTLWHDMEPGERRRIETRYRRNDSEAFPVEVNLQRLDVKEDRFIAAARDVSVQKEQKRELRRDKERFKLLVQEVKEYAIFVLGPEGRIRSWNEGAERIKGYQEAEILGEPLSTFYTAEDREAGVPEENLTRAKREGSVQEEGWRVRKDGSRFWANVTITALRDENGDLRGFSKVTQDLTDRKKQERRYEAIFNQTYQFIGLMEPDGTLIEANETALEFGGIDREDVIGGPFWEASWWQVDDETQRELREAIDRAAEGEFVRYDVEVQGKKQNVTIDFSIRPILNEQGEVTLLIPEGRNITELKALKRRERELERTRNLLTQAQQLASVGGWQLDVRGDPPHVPEWTDELYDLFEISQDEVPSVETILKFFPPEAREKRRRTINHAVESGEGWDQESRMTTANRNERWVRSIGETIVENGEVVALHGALQDITARKEREEQLERQNQRLDQFASLVSHDLRGPLNVAKGRLALAQEEDDPEHVAATERALDRMDAIIEDLLTLTWGGQDVSPDDLEVHDLATVTTTSWGCVDTAGATLQLDGDFTLRADEGRLRRLLENLFRNAVEHGGAEVTVQVGALDDGFFVADDGAGIPEAKREKVLDQGYSSREEGTGLGLSIAQAIADTHGWTLSVTESDERGARFEITGVDPMRE